ncbi:hypothetical protein AVDCRST_MAG94-5101 [uncultured Leptolyngbya sp.]|uniref:Uncharacterized protein n=1 Tax=uncultured Leptolyngbya sp. TaxID=332963 RepID=A0A6J4NDY7_9CYAN|nr:hypothetical protein AVDCRST_MAG94-5101 [uncultured Leptolyngbya sp.]
MDLAAALAAIQNCDTLPNRADIFAAVNAEINGKKAIEDERDRVVQSKAEILNEKKKLQVEKDKVQRLLDEAISDVEGESIEEKSGKLKALSQKVAELEKAKVEAETKATEAETKAVQLEQGLLYQRVAAKVGADPDALTKLVNLPSDRLSIEDDGVSVWDEAKANKQPLKEYAKTLGEWQSRAIFPEVVATAPTAPTQQRSQPAPNAPPSSTPKKEVNATSVLSGLYTGIPKKA